MPIAKKSKPKVISATATAFKPQAIPRPKAKVRVKPGRPVGTTKYGEPSKVIRIPESAAPVILDFLDAYRKRQQYMAAEKTGQDIATQHAAMRDLPEGALLPAENPSPFDLPLYAHSVPAGMAAPVDEHIADRLDLNSFLIRNPGATFYFRVSGDSMNRTTLQDSAIAAVDCSRLPKNGDAVLAVIDGDFTVKRYVKIGRSFELQPDSTNARHRAIVPKLGQTIEIRGVIVGVVQRFI